MHFLWSSKESVRGSQPVQKPPGLADDDLTDSKTLDRNLQKRTTIQMSKKNKETRRQIGEEDTGPIGSEKRLTRDNGTKREWSNNPTNRRRRRRTGDGRTAAERPRSSRTKEQQQQGGEASEGRPPRNLVELSYYSSGSGTEADESSIREWLINLRLSSPAGVAGFREDGRTRRSGAPRFEDQPLAYSWGGGGWDGVLGWGDCRFLPPSAPAEDLELELRRRLRASPARRAGCEMK